MKRVVFYFVTVDLDRPGLFIRQCRPTMVWGLQKSLKMLKKVSEGLFLPSTFLVYE